MNRIKDYSKLENQIVEWMKDYLKSSGMRGWILGVSGGIDSAVASTLAAKTGMPLMVLEMPIKQAKNQMSRGKDHINWLKENFENVQSREIDLNVTYSDLSPMYNVFDLLMKQMNKSLGIVEDGETANLAEANSRSRLRMLMLYYTGTISSSLVVGTGNKVEDFGVGFYTKYGDGGVDLSPLADLYKTEVRALGKHMGIIDSIITCKPTDGLWDDGRTDEDQLGSTYENLEWAMEYLWSPDRVGTDNEGKIDEAKSRDFLFMKPCKGEIIDVSMDFGHAKAKALEVIVKRYSANRHKMNPIPVCEIDKSNLEKVVL